MFEFTKEEITKLAKVNNTAQGTAIAIIDIMQSHTAMFEPLKEGFEHVAIGVGFESHCFARMIKALITVDKINKIYSNGVNADFDSKKAKEINDFLSMYDDSHGGLVVLTAIRLINGDIAKTHNDNICQRALV